MWVKCYFSVDNCDTFMSTYLFCSHTGTRYDIFIDTYHVNIPRSQLGYLPLLPNAWQNTAGYPHFLPHTGSLGVSPSLSMKSISLGWEFNSGWDLKGRNSSLHVRLPEGRLDNLMFMQFSYLHLMLSGYEILECIRVLHHIFLMKAAAIGFNDWLKILAIWMDCIL